MTALFHRRSDQPLQPSGGPLDDGGCNHLNIDPAMDQSPEVTATHTPPRRVAPTVTSEDVARDGETNLRLVGAVNEGEISQFRLRRWQ